MKSNIPQNESNATATQGRPEVAEAEVTVTATGQWGMTPNQFIGYLHANGYTGNTGTNPNYPGVAWIGFWNSP